MSVSPFKKTLTADLPAATLAAESYALCEPAPSAGVVQEVRLVPMAALTGADTNSRTFNAYNRTRGKTIGTKAFTNGVNAADNVAFTLTLSATPDDLVVAAGDVIELESLHIGTGVAAPQCKAIVRVSGSY
jgi:hypothetical protein